MIIDTKDAWDNELGLGVFRGMKTPTVRSGLRKQVYTASLTQAVELWESANSVSALASPILRFYALMQAAQAIAASSSLPNNSWRAREGHGLHFEAPSVAANTPLPLDQVLISESGSNMAAQTLALALKSPLLSHATPLMSLIASLEHQRVVSKVENGHLRPLRVFVTTSQTSIDPNLLIEGVLNQAWLTSNQGVEVPEGEIRTILAGYPSLRGLPAGLTGRVEEDITNRGKHYLRLSWEHNPFGRSWEGLDILFDQWTSDQWNRRNLPALSFPALGGNDQAQHPLVTWYLIFYGFSMLARYRGPQWRRLLDKDEGIVGTFLERLVNVDSSAALDLVGMTLLRQLRDSNVAG